MSGQEPYEFGDLGLSGVAPGTTLLVTGSTRATSTVADDLVLAGADTDDGMVFVSTERSGSRLVTDCTTRRPDLDTSRLGVIDASGAGEFDTDTDALTGSVSSSSDLTGISIEFSVLYSKLYGQGRPRVRVAFDSVSILLLYTSLRTMTRFVHTMVGRIRKTGGLGVFVLDPTMHDQQTTRTLQRLTDGTVEVRYEDGPEIRVQGLPDQPDGWLPVDL